MKGKQPESHRVTRRPSGSHAKVTQRHGASDQSKRELERASSNRLHQPYLFRLFITGTTPASARAVEQVIGACELHLAGRYQLDVVDIYQKPLLAREDQIIAIPTLIRMQPPPIRRYIGDLSKVTGSFFESTASEKS